MPSKPRIIKVGPAVKIDPDTDSPTVLRDPINGKAIPWEGRDVEDSMYWRRRIKDGSARIVEAKSAKRKAGDDEEDEVDEAPKAGVRSAGSAMGDGKPKTEPGASGGAKEFTKSR